MHVAAFEHGFLKQEFIYFHNDIGFHNHFLIALEEDEHDMNAATFGSGRFVLSVMVAGLACWPLQPTHAQSTPETVPEEEQLLSDETLNQFKLKTLVVKEKSKEAKRLADPVPQTEVIRKDIEIRSNRRLGDVIQRQPGVFMGGPAGENRQIRLRGLGQEFNRLQLDGIQLPGSGRNREIEANRIPSFLVDSVKIIRNPTAEYESDGLAGRVDVTTRPIPKDPFTAGRIGYGGRNGLNGDLVNGSLAYGSRFGDGDWFGIMATADHLDQTLFRSTTKTFSPIADGKEEREQETKKQVSTNVSLDLGFFYPAGEVHLKPTFLSITDESLDRPKMVTDPNKPAASNQEQELNDEARNLRTTGFGLSHRHLFPKEILLESVGGYYKTDEFKDGEKTKFKEAGSALAFDKIELKDETKEDRFWTLSTKLTAPVTMGFRQLVKVGGTFRLRDRSRLKTTEEINKDGVFSDVRGVTDNSELSEDYFAGFIQVE